MGGFTAALPLMLILAALLSAGAAWLVRDARRAYGVALGTQGILAVFCLLLALFSGEAGFLGWQGLLWMGPAQGTIGAAGLGVGAAVLLAGRRELCKTPPRRGYFPAVGLLSGAFLTLLFADHLLVGLLGLSGAVIAVCALITSRGGERELLAAVRFLSLHLLGVCFILMGLALLRGITGTLSLPGVQAALTGMGCSSPLILALWLIVSGIVLSGGLFPTFRSLAAVHEQADVTASALLSAQALPGSALLLSTLLLRGLPQGLAADLGLTDALLTLGAVGMLAGGLAALRERHVDHLLAFSSSAQLGGIYLALGLGTQKGMAAADFYLLVHGCCFALLFLCAGKLSQNSGGSRSLHRLRGSAHASPLSAVGFTLGALSLIGLPTLGGFASKLFLASAAIFTRRTIVTLLNLSTTAVLSALCFIPAVMALWERPKAEKPTKTPRDPAFAVGVGLLILWLFGLGVGYHPVMDLLHAGTGLS